MDGLKRVIDKVILQLVVCRKGVLFSVLDTCVDSQGALCLGDAKAEKITGVTMSVVAIVQARMGSTRLPGKVMLPLAGGTILQTVCDRVGAAARVDRVVVATSMTKADAEIQKFCHFRNIACFRGSETDVLDRVYQAAVAHNAEYVVDVTADCPLVDPRHIDRIVSELQGTSRSYQPTGGNNDCFDYVSNCWLREWPDGLDVQAYTMAALEKVWVSRQSVREHVGWNIPKLEHVFSFNMRQICAPPKYNHPEWGLTVDERLDYDLMKRLFSEAMLVHGDNLFPVEFVLDWLLENKSALDMNAGVERKTPGAV